MLGYFFALLAPIVLLPLIPLLGRLLGNWLVNRPEVDPRRELSARLTAFRKQQNQRGMTLVEILVALPILMIGLLGLMTVVPYAANNIQTGSTVSTATFLSNARIDQMKALALNQPGGYSLAFDATGACFITNDSIPASTVVESDVPVNGHDNVGYSRTTTIADDAHVCPLKTVTVTTAFNGKALSTITLQIGPR